jgi:hypothetical protein
LIKDLLGAAASRCAPLCEPVAWAGLSCREMAGMGYAIRVGGCRGAAV